MQIQLVIQGTMNEEDVMPSDLFRDESGFLVTPMLHVGDFLRECEQVVGSEELMLPEKLLKSHGEMAEIMGSTAEVVQELEKVCSPEVLHTPAEDGHPLDIGTSLGTAKGIPPGADHLKTLQLRHKRYGKMDRRYRKRDIRGECFSAALDDEEDICVNKPTAVLSVTFFRATQSIHQTNVYRAHFIDRELLVMTHQKLTALRDKIICAADLSVASGEYSEVPDAPQEPKQQDLYKSSYFVIEDTFYNDLRDPLSRDLSKVVMGWLKSKRTMYSKTMDDVTFNDLDIRLGYPYLYNHLGNCQHIMVFTDLRLLTNTDCQDPSMYPVLIQKPRWRRVICICCNVYTAKWKTYRDSFSNVDPSFFCEKCFKMLHYDKQGNKLGSFTAYPYVDPGIFS